MPKNAVAKSYSSLLAQIKKTIASGRRQIEYVKALTYWHIGEHISKHLLSQDGRADYGKKLYQKLSRDLRLDVRTIQQTVQFHREMPITSARSQLDWTHFRKLITVDDALTRNRLLKKAKQDNLTTRQLAIEITRATSSRKRATKTASRLIPKRGQLYVYKLIDVNGTIEIDCGFHVTRAIPISGIASPKAGTRVISQKSKSGFDFSLFNGASRDLYTYKAGSIRVIDGDTLSCRIDCGFKTKIKRSLRLRGINAPEKKTKAGEASKRFVQRRLRDKSVIILRSYGVDNYGRYVADVFYNAEDGHEVYLNQEILNAGYAK